MAEPDDVVVGIDLGTTYSCVSVFQQDKAKVLANDHGNRITPSFVAFTDKGQLLGDDARMKLTISPANTVYESKRLIGRTFDEPCVQKDRNYWPFTVIDDGGKPKIQVYHEQKTKLFWPEEISAMVLLKMKNIAQNQLGKKVTKAVITVPAYFNESQRHATKTAAKIAGLEVFRIINEPTAAALAYGMGMKSKGEKCILIFDLGGGTFDVSILEIDEGVFRVLATGGDTHLGGSDFDNKLTEEILNWFNKKHNLESDVTTDVRQRQLHRLRFACEYAKRQLSETECSEIHIDKFHEDQDLVYNLEREHFEELNKESFQKTISITQQVMDEANLSSEDINDIILVGGSTRIPKIKKMLQSLFPGKKLNDKINPDEAVACGAAIQAAIMSGNQSNKTSDMMLMDVTPLSLGVEIKDGIMLNVILHNSLIPCRKAQDVTTIEDDQTEVTISVYQGERTNCKDNHFLGEFTLDGISPAPASVPDLEIAFSLDVDGCLEATAKDRDSGKAQSMKIEYNKSRCSEEEIESLVRDADEHKNEDTKEKERLQARHQLETFAHWIKYILSNHTAGLDVSTYDKSALLEQIRATNIWLSENLNNDRADYIIKKQELVDGCRFLPPKYLTPGKLPDREKVRQLWNPSAPPPSTREEDEDDDDDDDEEVPEVD